MALKDRLQLLTTPEKVDQFLKRHPDSAIFKAGACHKTDEAFRHVHAVLDPREDVPVGLIQVVEARPASNHVETLTGITHESPQLIVFRDGKAVFGKDNWDITPEAIQDVLRQHFAAVPQGRP
jgi:bacillithiol system protein YtxJ